jgi:hypothetical protein
MLQKCPIIIAFKSFFEEIIAKGKTGPEERSLPLGADRRKDCANFHGQKVPEPPF